MILNGFLYKKVQKQFWVAINRPILSGKVSFHLGSPVTAHQKLAFHQPSGSDSVSPPCKGSSAPLCAWCLLLEAEITEIEFILFNAELEHQNAAAEGFIRDSCDLFVLFCGNCFLHQDNLLHYLGVWRRFPKWNACLPEHYFPAFGVSVCGIQPHPFKIRTRVDKIMTVLEGKLPSGLHNCWLSCI